MVAPPAFAGGVWRQFVAHHVFLALGIGVVYEVAVAILGFLTVIARDISFRWQGRLADSLDLAIRRKITKFENRYREFLLASLRFVDLKGLATTAVHSPELAEVFVDVSLVSSAPHQIHQSVLSDLAGTGRRALSEFIGRREASVLAVVGGPGSGKTTLLRHTARHTCLRGSHNRAGRRLAYPTLPTRSRICYHQQSNGVTSCIAPDDLGDARFEDHKDGSSRDCGVGDASSCWTDSTRLPARRIVRG